MHGTKASNLGVSSCDLLIAVGTRFSDRVLGNPKTFASNAKIVQIDVDPAEFGKLTEEVETLAGLLLEIKGDFPRRREIIDYNHYRFQVLEVDNRRILKVKFNSLPVEPQPEEKA